MMGFVGHLHYSSQNNFFESQTVLWAGLCLLAHYYVVKLGRY